MFLDEIKQKIKDIDPQLQELHNKLVPYVDNPLDERPPHSTPGRDAYRDARKHYDAARQALIDAKAYARVENCPKAEEEFNKIHDPYWKARKAVERLEELEDPADRQEILP